MVAFYANANPLKGETYQVANMLLKKSLMVCIIINERMIRVSQLHALALLYPLPLPLLIWKLQVVVLHSSGEIKLLLLHFPVIPLFLDDLRLETQEERILRTPLQPGRHFPCRFAAVTVCKYLLEVSLEKWLTTCFESMTRANSPSFFACS